MKLQGFTTSFKLVSGHVAFFLQINSEEFVCIYTSEENCYEEVDFAWYPSSIYKKEEIKGIRAANIDSDDIFQIPESLLNYFVKVSEEYTNKNNYQPSGIVCSIDQFIES